MKNITNDDKKRLLEKYFNDFNDSYTNNEIERIIKNFGISFKDDMTQIYAYLSLLENFENPYVGFTDIIEKKIGLNHNFIEVGGGVYPALANEISKRQIKLGIGTITVFDPLLGINNLKGIKLMKEPFTNNTNVQSFDILIGKEPCMATDTLIEKARENNKSFVVSPCKCYSLLPEYIEYESDPLRQWYSYVKDLCMPINQRDRLETNYLISSYHYTNPIFTYTKVFK